MTGSSRLRCWILYLLARSRLMLARHQVNTACCNKTSKTPWFAGADLAMQLYGSKEADPFVLGRGGEEIRALAYAGITAEVIPGITAANGCAASTGIPLTHRGVATTCTFVPGQLSEDGGQLDWTLLARPMQTLVFYMAVKNVGKRCSWALLGRV